MTLAVAMTAVTAWVVRGTHGGPGPVRLGAIYPLSGPQGEGGSDEHAGVELAVRWANEHGGVDGRDVELRTVDVARAEAAPVAMETLAADDVEVVLGSHGSAISASAAATASGLGMVLWETGAVGEIAPSVAAGRSFFRLAAMGATLGHNAVAFVADELGPLLGVDRPLRWGVAYVDDPYGRAVAQGALDEAARRGTSVVGRFPYDAALPDPVGLAREIAAAGVEALFVAAYLDDGVALRRAMVDHGVPLVASIGTSSSYCHPAFGDRLGDAAVGLYASDKPDADDVRPDALTTAAREALEWARREYEEARGEPMASPALSGFAHAYALLAHVLPEADTPDAEGVAAAALRVKLPAGSLPNGGGLDVAPPGGADAGENRAAAAVIWEWIEPRTRAVVWPPAFATHEIVPLGI